MNINYNILSVPENRILITSMSSGYGRQQLINDIVAQKQCAFTIKPFSKTSLDVRISVPNTNENWVVGVNTMPPGAEKFKFLTRRYVSPYYGTETFSHYFKVLKSQGANELKEYLEIVLKDLLQDHADLDLTATVVFYGTESLLNINELQ